MASLRESIGRALSGVGGYVSSAGGAVASFGRDTQHLAASWQHRAVSDWETYSGSADVDNNPELETITARARDIDRNSGIAKNMREASGDNVVGTGLQVVPMPNWRVFESELYADPEWSAEWGERGPAEWAADWSRRAKAHWLDYSRGRFVDADAEDNFHQLTRLMYDSEWQSGSACAVPMWKERTGTPYRTCINVIESDRLSNPAGTPETYRLSGGVERQEDGEIIAYHVRSGHPGEAGVRPNAHRWTRIPARHPWGRPRFVHLYRKTRPGQSRGVSAVSSVLAAFGLHGKYQLTELQSANALAKIVQVLETPLSDEQAAALYGGTKEAYSRHREGWNAPMNAGSVLKLPVGTTAKNLDPKRPAPAFASFMQHIVREIGVGVSLPYELAARDFSKTNYSSARAALLEAWRHFYVERQRLVYQWASTVYELWLEEAVELGILEAPGFALHRAAWCHADWVAPSHLPIDRLKHENANKIAFENGTATRQAVLAEVGLDWEEVAEQRYRERLKEREVALRMQRAEMKLREELGMGPGEPFDPEADPSPVGIPPQSDEDIDRDDELNDDDTDGRDVRRGLETEDDDR